MSKRKNIENSIVLIGPCNVGKSLISSHLSERTNIPMIDVDDLICFVRDSMLEDLSGDKEKQKEFIETRKIELQKLERDVPLTEVEQIEETKLIQEYVDLYNYYCELLGDLKKFYLDVYEYYASCNDDLTEQEEIFLLNKLTLKIINIIYETTDRCFIISPPASFGWNDDDLKDKQFRDLQKKINRFLRSTKNIFLQPGQDYYKRIPEDENSVNVQMFLKNLDGYYPQSDLEISTNGLFDDVENEFLKQKTWMNVREYMTKQRLKNSSEINSICDQIIENLRNESKIV
ncbi:MAG: hypothetical protein E7374_00630 [Clostridiales bacterium]|nr:hypothetical protein [Clostridiales bacterium]